MRLGAIGDVIQCAVALSAYKKKHPDAEIYWAVSKTLVPFVEVLGGTHKVIPVDYEGLVRGSFVSRLWVLVKEIRNLSRFGSFDAVFNAHSDSRYKLLTLLLRRGRNVKVDREFPIVHRYRVFEYYRLLGGADSSDIDFGSSVEVLRKNLSSHLQPSGTLAKSRRYIVLAPGGASNLISDAFLRRWPINYYVELAKRIIDSGYDVVLVGAGSDVDLSFAFSKVTVKDLIGKTDLFGLFRVMENAIGVVTHDSGPLHVATLTYTPIVALFGPTPANAFISIGRPYTAVLHQANKVSCSPCYDGKTYAHCLDNRCLKNLDVNLVFERLMEVVEQKDRGCLDVR